MKLPFNKLHIISWVIKDSLWCLQLPSLAKIMVIPTIFFSLYMLWKEKENRLENLTVFSWILMNVSWMMHEFHSQIPKYISYGFMSSSIILSILMVVETYRSNYLFLFIKK
jgi:hypothetical protein